MGCASLATRFCEMPTMIRPKRTFAANNATATPQTLAPSRVRASAMGTKKLGYRSSRAVTLGADNGASAYPLRGSAPASAACRRPRQLATNAPRLLNARSLSGSSPCDGYEKKPGYRGSRAVMLGADNGARTRDPNLGKVVLYQLSHVRICKTKRAPERPDVAWRRSPDSNRG